QHQRRRRLFGRGQRARFFQRHGRHGERQSGNEQSDRHRHHVCRHPDRERPALSSTPDTLTGANATNAWAITGANSGTVNGLNFANFGNLTGGSAVDTFTVGTSGSLTGTVNGGGGSNILVGPNLPSTFNIAAKNAGNLTSSTGVLSFTSILNLTGGAQ